MVLDYIAGGELYQHLDQRGTFSEDIVRFYSAQIVLALGFLHEHKVMYPQYKSFMLSNRARTHTCE